MDIHTDTDISRILKYLCIFGLFGYENRFGRIISILLSPLSKIVGYPIYGYPIYGA